MMLVGLAGEGTAWWLVASRGWDVWRLLTPVLAAMGLAALAVGPPPLSPEVDPWVAAALGLPAGVALYAATWAFVSIVRRWGRFGRHAAAMYERQGSLPLALALALSVGLTVPGEELFWRGLFQGELAGSLGAGPAALASWAAFVLANLPAANLAIAAGAIVGGAVWTLLGWWSGGVLAPLVCHAVWASLMLSLPVVRVPVEAEA